MSHAEEEYRREERKAVLGRVVRLVVGFLLIGLSPVLGFLAPFIALLGCIVIAPDVAGFFVWLLELIFVGGHRPPKPMPIYSIPESLVQRGKFAEAEEAYEKIIAEFPDEIKPHADMITLAVIHLDDAELAEKLYQRGLASLRSQERKDELARLYPVLLSRRERHDVAKRK